MATLTLQPDGATGVDTWLNVGAGSTNYGTSDTMRVGESNISSPDTDGQSVGLLKFNLSSLSTTTIITSAKIYMQVIAEYSGWNKTMNMYNCLKNWGNTTATWNKYNGVSNWSTAGARHLTADRGVLMSSRVMDQTYLGQVEWVLNTAYVQNWISGATANYGVILDYPTFPTGQDQYRFATSNHATAAYRPKIVIEYLTPAGGSVIWW